MRTQLLKLKRRTSTKAERRFSELLKRHRIPFRTKVRISGREIDFVIGWKAIDIDGHEQDSEKNRMLIDAGYIPMHIRNQEIGERIISKLK